MAPSKDNILAGTASLYVKEYAASNDPVSANAVSWSTWTQLGFTTEEGVNVEYAQEFLEAIVQERNAPVKKWLISESATISFTLQESDLAQMQYAISGADYTAGATPGTHPNTLEIGGGSATEYSLGIQGLASTGNALVIFVPKVIAMGTVGTPYSKGSVRVVPMEFGALSDTNETAGSDLMTYYELTSAAT